MRLPKKDQNAIANLISEMYDTQGGQTRPQGGYGSDEGRVTPEDIRRINNFLHNVVLNYAHSNSIPQEYKKDLQSWDNTEIDSKTYDTVYALLRNIEVDSQDTELKSMINAWANQQSSKGATNFNVR